MGECEYSPTSVSGRSKFQLNSPSRTSISVTSGMRYPYVMASMNGGHFLTVELSSPVVELKDFSGRDLNQSGMPSTAGVGRGRIFSSSGEHRNFSVVWLT